MCLGESVVCMCVCVRVFAFLWMCLWVGVNVFGRECGVYVCVRACVCVCVCVCARACVSPHHDIDTPGVPGTDPQSLRSRPIFCSIIALSM